MISVIVNITATFLLALVIAYIYKKTHRGLSYTPSFVSSLVLMGPILTVIMMVVGTSIARAFTVFGAFTLIRFRTAIKDTRDITFVLWILMTGLAVGSNHTSTAVISTIMIGLAVLIVHKIKIGTINIHEYVMIMRMPTDSLSTNAYKDTFERYIKFSNLLSTISDKNTNKTEMSFQISFKDDASLMPCIQELKEKTEIEEVIINRTQGDLEF